MIMTKFLLLPFMFMVFFAVSRIEAGSIDSRNLQSGVSFVANYSAGFQYLQDPLCVGDPPNIHITCFGNNLTILGYSDPSISCVELSTPDFANSTTHECKSNCSDCSDVYLTNGDVRDSPVASIYYACEGDTLLSAGSAINYLGGNNGTCAGSSVTGTVVDSRNFHVARLGVSCPVGSSRHYLFDDTYFECFSSISETPINIASIGENDVYACGIGTNCRGEQCTVAFSNLYIIAEVDHFSNSCVDSTVPITPAPVLAPTSSIFEYSAQFQAIWGRLVEPETSESVCDSSNSAVVVSCGNGASISFVNASDLTMVCSPLNKYELTCIGDSNAVDNLFTTITFNCSGPMFPFANVTYPGSVAFCDGNSVNTTVSHAVGLNIFCASPEGGFFYTGENFVECGDSSDRFDLLASDYGLDEYLHFVCIQHFSFPSGSFASNPQDLSRVTISTDAYWNPGANIDGCYSRGTLGTPTTVSIPTPSPIISTQVSLFPSASPTEKQIPTQSPTEANLPNATPVTGPVGVRSATPIATTDDGSNTAAVAGGAFAGVAICAIIAFLFTRKPRTSEDISQNKPPGSETNTSSSGNNTNSNTFQEHLSEPSTVVGSPYLAQNSSLASDVANAQAPIQPQAIRTSYSGTPIPMGNSHDLRFKDQARSVIGPSQSSVPMVVPGVPMAEAIPIAVAMDSSAASGNSRNSIKSEPPGRRAVDP